jgi:integrase
MGMKGMSGNQRLKRHGNGLYYYRRRVPLGLVEKLGKQFIQFSLRTRNLAQAKKLRAAADVQWDARFEAAEGDPIHPGGDTSPPLGRFDPAGLLDLVRDYVTRKDEEARRLQIADPPQNDTELREMQIEAEWQAQTARIPFDPDLDEWISRAGRDILETAGKQNAHAWTADFVDLVRRAILELSTRRSARLSSDYGRSFFDHLFDPTPPPREATFGQLADQLLQMNAEKGEANNISPKGIDKQRATMALIRELVGDQTPLSRIDYDFCLSLRSRLARVPANRTKIYCTLTIDEAIERARSDGKSLLAAETQKTYLSAFREVLDLAFKKRLIPGNPADGLAPVKRDDVPSGERRRSFTPEQLIQFFGSPYYAECASSPEPFAHDKNGWRFWLPLICLLMGMRPNEVAQMHTNDFKYTKAGTPYLDIAATADDDDNPLSAKTLKTAASRRKLPVHPELINIGLLKFIERQRTNSASPRLFPELKPDKYGNHATYALRRFREAYLPNAIEMQSRQTFYSFRHTFRDALRRVDAQPATLEALGGWTQRKSTSDDYGEKFHPDYQAQYMAQIAFQGLDLSHLYPQGDDISVQNQEKSINPDPLALT